MAVACSTSKCMYTCIMSYCCVVALDGGFDPSHVTQFDLHELTRAWCDDECYLLVTDQVDVSNTSLCASK